MKTLLAIACVIVLLSVQERLLAQTEHPDAAPMNAAEMHIALRKLSVTGTVLYVAAHPDDENTALLAYFSKGKKYRTVYLSLTRGEGGQNILGPEKGTDLGVIRTQELMDARRIDGAEQMFTRAIDFGFSKSPVESMNMWGGDNVIADIVWAIRTVRPDIIITRFSPTEGGHGNHTASAILAIEAYKRSGDPAWYPEQLRYARPWKAKKLFYNRLNGFDGGPMGPATGDKTIDVGAFDPVLGLSYTEIAGISRSMHKTQAQGTAQIRGSHPEYFQLTDLDSSDAALMATGGGASAHRAGTGDDDLFSDIETTWKRYAGSAEIEKHLFLAQRNFDPEHPERILPLLLRVAKQIALLGSVKTNASDPVIEYKRREVTGLIASCIGLRCTAVASHPQYVPDQTLGLSVELAAHAGVPMLLRAVRSPRLHIDTLLNRRIQPDASVIIPLAASVPASMQFTQPYWLASPPAAMQMSNPVSSAAGPLHEYAQMHPAHLYLYIVPSQLYVGLPENPDSLVVTCELNVTGESVTIPVPVRFRTVDPIAGEQHRPVAIVPSVDVAFSDKLLMWTRPGVRQAAVHVTTAGPVPGGTLRLVLPKGYTSSPVSVSLPAMKANEERSYEFSIDADSTSSTDAIGAVVDADRQHYYRHGMDVSYPHIVPQHVMHEAAIKAMRADVQTAKHLIGYVMGSGDEVPAGLQRCGYTVDAIGDDTLRDGGLEKYEAIVVGVRAYNVREAVRQSNARLLEYVRNGGTLLVQYQTPGKEVEAIGPYSFRISRDRVTDETAVMTSPFAQSQTISGESGPTADTARAGIRQTAANTMAALYHRLMTVPNRLSAADFEGWVQERGLYFADRWDDRFMTPFICADPGESPQRGSLLVARYGKGVYCYTGLSFFRQLPAGVAGAFRLLGNLVELTQ